MSCTYVCACVCGKEERRESRVRRERLLLSSVLLADKVNFGKVRKLPAQAGEGERESCACEEGWMAAFTLHAAQEEEGFFVPPKGK